MVLQYAVQNSEKYAFRRRDEVQKARVATAAALLTSFIADADVVTDWLYFAEILSRGGDNDEEDPPVPSWIRALQLASCVCGTLSWLAISSDGRLMEWLRRAAWWIAWSCLRVTRIAFYDIPRPILKRISCGNVDLRYSVCCGGRINIREVLGRAEHKLDAFFGDGFRISSGGLLMVGIVTEDLPQIVVTFLIEDAMGSFGGGKGISRSAYLNLVLAIFDVLHKLASAWDDWKLYIGTGTGIRTYTRHTGLVLSLASVGPDRIVSASHDGTARLWDIATGKTVTAFDLGGRGWAGTVAKLGNDRILTTSSSCGMNIFDIDSGKCLKSISINDGCNATCTVVTNNGKHFLTSKKESNEITKWDAYTLEAVKTYQKEADSLVTLDNDQLVSSNNTEGEEGYPVLWNVASGDIIRYFNIVKCNSKVTAMCKYDAGSFLVASVNREDTGIVIDMFTVGQSYPIKTTTIAGNEVYLIASVDDDRFVTCEWMAENSTVDLWEFSSGTRLHTFRGHSGPIYDILYLPEEGKIATASYDSTVKIWPVPKLDDIINVSTIVGI